MRDKKIKKNGYLKETWGYLPDHENQGMQMGRTVERSSFGPGCD